MSQKYAVYEKAKLLHINLKFILADPIYITTLNLQNIPLIVI